MKQSAATIDLPSLSDWHAWSDRPSGWDIDAAPTVRTGRGSRGAVARVTLTTRRAPEAPSGNGLWRRVRVPLSVIYPGLRDVEVWTLDTSATLRLLVVLVALVSFGAALFA